MGQGGVGKTTIAAALMHDESIRGSFEKLVWVTVGQEPDLRELQDSIFFQISGLHFPESVKQDDEAFKAIRDAAKGCKLLLVLDDVWDPKHEKPLNCIDLDNMSRLLVTTRIRGLLKNTTEVDVGVLGKEEALKLLLAYAEMDAGDLEEDGHLKAVEIVELCGRLPLTLAIAGGMVADYGQGFTDDLLDVLKEKQELEDEEGTTIESRVISSSVKMLVKGAGKHKDLVGKVFEFFAVFPEDVPVPAPFFNKVAPLLSDDKNEKKGRLAVGTCLGTLLKYNLLKGSLSAGSGVFMHDIVRDYVIAQHSSEDLRLLQQSVVATILAARPEPDGFALVEFTKVGTFEGYCTRHAFWHIRGALAEGEELPRSWLCHPDSSIRSNVAMAVGIDALAALSDAREAAGKLVDAAQASWTASLSKSIALSNQIDLVFRAAGLLESADSAEAQDFEVEVLGVATNTGYGTARFLRANDRMLKLSASTETFDSKLAECSAAWSIIPMKLGIFGGDVDVEGSLDAMRAASRVYLQMGKMAHKPTWKMWGSNIGHPFCLFWILVASPFERWDPEEGGCTEAGMVEAIEFYENDVCGAIMKSEGLRTDYFLSMAGCMVLLLWYGNLEAFDVWHNKVLVAGKDRDYPTSRNYKEMELVVDLSTVEQAPMYCMLGLLDKAADMLNVCGFTWDDAGFERFDEWLKPMKAIFPPVEEAYYIVMIRICIFLSSPPGSIDEVEVSEWMPSPQELAHMEKNYVIFRYWSTIGDVTSCGAKAFLRLGRDDDAYELASIACSAEQATPKKWTLVFCFSILGQIAAKRGYLEEAEGHFGNAVKEAKLSRLPMLEVVAARDWKKYLLKPNGRDCEAAESVIDGACVKMKKTREQLSSVLLFEG